MVLARVSLNRRDDPLQEFRELLLVQVHRNFAVEQVIGFSSVPDSLPIERRDFLKFGSEYQMRQFLKEEAERLAKKEGFTITHFTAGR
jgi:hypothetical protein